MKRKRAKTKKRERWAFGRGGDLLPPKSVVIGTRIKCGESAARRKVGGNPGRCRPAVGRSIDRAEKEDCARDRLKGHLDVSRHGKNRGGVDRCTNSFARRRD